MQLAKPFAALGVLVLAASAALAQSYPSKPIRLIVPQASGGGSDLVALSKTRPGKFNYGSAGPTTFGGMATEWLIRSSGADFTGVT